MIKICFVILSLAVSNLAVATVRVQQIHNPKIDTLQILNVENTPKTIPNTINDMATHSQVLRSFPLYVDEDIGASSEIYEEILFDDQYLPTLYKNYIDQTNSVDPKLQRESEVRTLVLQGPTKNRINLTILGDGYTTNEKQKFFDDAQRIADDLFKAKTFSSYLPLFNVFAVFLPSQDSGITDLIAKNTAFGLYRSPKGSKRAIMPGNSGTIEKAIKLAPATDFPIIIANDDYYGGLGGRFAITTRSIRSGTMVLRHELGHNFGEVGEEYDGGQIYTGANHSDTAAVPWKHWVDGEIAVSQASYLSGAYVWQNLNNQNVRVEFDFPSKNTLGDQQFNAIISSVGWQTPQDVDVYLDNQKVSIKGAYTDDRSFFEIDHLDKTLVPGKHVLEFKENIHDGNNILAFAMLYAMPANYDFTKDKIGAFNTFYSPDSPSGFRPSHNTCLMREMRSVEFCSVDKENMWIRFLNRVSLIDELGINSNGNEKLVYLKTPDLSGLQLRWYQLKANQEPIALHDLDGLKQWSTHNMSAGKYRVEVEFKTPEVRNYTNSFRVTRDISF